ncbi:RDD family protein [Euzebya sp.]|uniref:RDD family protein n=1 Tax=Euzebya sp. TaxID=1971409 RepID=UPI003518843B
MRVDLPLADVGSRALSILIDLFLMATVLYILVLLAVAAVGAFTLASGGGPAWPLIVVILVLNFLVLWGYPVGSETLFGGRSAGKAALGLRVVTTDGAPVRFRHAAIRGLFAFVDFYLFLGIPAVVTALVTRKGQRLGDLAAGTVIIRDRTGTSPADQVVFWQVPPALRGYASTLDVRGLNAADYALVRRFLLRAGSLQPAHRARVATDLATAMADRMRHRPPAGTHPEALLLCIAALLQAPTLRGPGAAPPPPGPRPAATPPPSSASPGPPFPRAPLPSPGAPRPTPPPAGDGPFAPPS